MKKTKNLLVIVFMVIVHGGMAQITQLELASGLNKTDFTSFSLRPLSPNANFSVGTLAFFQKYYQEESLMFDEAGVHSTLYWNIGPTTAVGSGLYYNSVAGFSQRLSFLYVMKSPHFVLTAIPTMAQVEQTGINGEMFLQLQLTLPLKENWQILLSAQILTNWVKLTHHSRSFQQLRFGMDKHTAQFGVAIDFDQYGDSPITRTSYGVFVRKIFINNK